MKVMIQMKQESQKDLVGLVVSRAHQGGIVRAAKNYDHVPVRAVWKHILRRTRFDVTISLLARATVVLEEVSFWTILFGETKSKNIEQLRRGKCKGQWKRV
jgi:hypothetical protein